MSKRDGQIIELKEKVSELTDDLEHVCLTHAATTKDLHGERENV